MLALTALAPAHQVAATGHPRISVTGLPAFFALVLDSARKHVYASDPSGNRVFTLDATDGHKISELDFPNFSYPEGMDISPDGSTLAVAMNGLGHIQLINLADGSLGDLMVPNPAGAPADVKYGRAGRLYSVGAGNGDYLHVFDTTTNLQLTRSSQPQVFYDRLAISADHNSLFMLGAGSGGADIQKFDVSADSVDNPVEHVQDSYSQVLTVSPDGSTLFTNTGMVWAAGLQHKLGTFDSVAQPCSDFTGGISYAGGHVLVSSRCTSHVAVIDGTAFPYNLLGTIDLTGTVESNVVDAVGSVLYVSTSTEFDVVDLTQPLTPPPVRQSVQPYLDMVLDEPRGLLYATDGWPGKVRILSATDGSVVGSIDVGRVNFPVGLALSPDGSKLAVTLQSAGQVILIGLPSHAIVGHMYILSDGRTGPSTVVFGRPGRLYASSRDLDGGTDGIHIFDTTTDLEVGNVWIYPYIYYPRLAISPDGNTLFDLDEANPPGGLVRIDVSTDAPPAPLHYFGNPKSGDIVVSSDNSKVFISGGPVYSADLSTQLGTLQAPGSSMAYSAAAGRLFVVNNGGIGTITSVFTNPPFAADSARPLTSDSGPPQVGPVDVDAAGTYVYLSSFDGVQVIKWGTPEPPTKVSAIHGDGQATVSWSAPTYQGTSPITQYTVTSSPGGVTKTVSGSTVSTPVTGLANGTSYTFTVKATNAIGDSRASAPSNAVTPRAPTVPTAPGNVSATPGKGKASISWTQSLDDGDSAITKYTVTSSPGGITVDTANASTFNAVVTGLTPGVSYTFTVKATNGIGTGPASAPSNTVIPFALTVPDPPTNVSATAGDTDATVSWSAADDGGSPITGFTVTSSPAGITTAAGPSDTSAVVSSLTNGTAYTFTVTATNAVGDSSPSAPSNSVTPLPPTTPEPPSNVVATGGHGQATVSWSTPFDGRKPITGYTVTGSPGGITVHPGVVNSTVVTGLTNGTTYTFRVVATNILGDSLPSAPSNPVTPGAPSEPRNVTAVAGVGSATITWIAPVDTGVTPITGYTVLSSGGASMTVGPFNHNAVLAGLSSSPHTFTVKASNSTGTGPASQPSSSVSPAAGGTYRSISPARILDSRNRNGGLPIRRVPANSAFSLQVTGRGGLPTTGVSAVVMNVTATSATGTGYLVAYPAGTTRPAAWNLTFVYGRNVSNLVIVPIGAGGKLTFYVSTSSTHLVADVVGWFGDSTNSYSRAGLFNPLLPANILDTRYGGNGWPRAKLGPGQSLTMQVNGLGGLPWSGVSAVVMDLTVTGPTASSYLIAYPTGSARPGVANMYFVPGQTVTNRVIVPVGNDGKVTIFNGAGYTNVIADVYGYFTNGWSTAGGSAFVALKIQRLDFTRLPSNYVLDIQFQPQSQITGLALNVTAANETGNGLLTLYPDDGSLGAGQAPPLTYDLTYRYRFRLSNMAITGLGFDFAYNTFNYGATTDIITDIEGYFGWRVPAPQGGIRGFGLTALIGGPTPPVGVSPEARALVTARYPTVRFSVRHARP